MPTCEPVVTIRGNNPLQNSDAVVALSPTLTVMSINHVTRWMVGHEAKPGTVFPLTRLVQEPELSRLKAGISSTLESGRPEPGCRAEIQCASGMPITCRYSIHPIFSDRRRVLGVLLTFHSQAQITSKRSRARRTPYPARYLPMDDDSLIEKLPEGIFTITAHWRITTFNKMAEELTGYRREEAIGRYCWEIFRSDKCKEHCPLRTALDSGQAGMDQEVRIFNKRGRRQAILVNTNVIRDSAGIVRGAVETFRPLTGEIYPPAGIDYAHSFANIIGRSEKMQQLFNMIPDIATSDVNVLITGESGTGKDLVARAIHNHSMRSKNPFIAVNCSALAESLLESELFGHEKAAFTGALQAKPGRFERANGGTLFLDEIGELKPELQVKLLRVIEQREFERVGGTKSLPMDARIISATNKSLSEGIRSGAIREDFYYRLRTVKLTLPPLRERKEDIPLLVNYFIKRFNRKFNKSVRSLDVKVMRFLQAYHFPGNVRELERILEHAFVFVKGPVIFMSSLPGPTEFKDPATPTPPRVLKKDRKSKEAILWALSQTAGNRQKTADLLSMSRTSLWRHMKKFGFC